MVETGSELDRVKKAARFATYAETYIFLHTQYIHDVKNTCRMYNGNGGEISLFWGKITKNLPLSR